MKTENIFDVAVVGGGPAGIMAAGKAGEAGARVVLLEKNKALGVKLLLTGKGRCNITNARSNLRELVSHYSKNGPFLFHAFSIFGPKETIAFFNKLGLKTKIERGKRVFPESDKASDVLKALLKYLKKNRVDVFFESEVAKVIFQNKKIEKLILKNKKEIRAKNYIFCVGGMSYPKTGSTGDGFLWAAELGHKIEEPCPVLVPIKIKESWIKDLQGLTLKNVEIKILENNKKEIKEFGELLFTHFGLSGPIILDISGKAGGLLKTGEVKILLDLKPALDLAKLDQRIQRDFLKYKNKNFENSLKNLLPVKLIPIIVKLSGIEPAKKVNIITKEERRKLAKTLKEIKMTAQGLMGYDRAITTAGGISLDEIDHKTMKSKIISNLFFAGEIIDVFGFTGGFNLQICWSTGYLAGENGAKQIYV